MCRFLLSVLLLLGAALGAGGCSDAAAPPVPPAVRQASQEAYAERLSATPDSVLHALAPADSFFLDYPAALFSPLRTDSAEARAWADSVLQTLSLDEKIGQLFIVRLPDSGLRGFLRHPARDLVREQHVAGFLVSRLVPPREVYAQAQTLQAEARVPLFFAADYERGAGRFSNALTELPSNMAIGAARDTVLAAAAGRLTAIESRSAGVNFVFAPVVDVNNNPLNPIINIRSYGEEADLVGAMAAAYVREAEAYGLLTTLKHFPGHGNTEVDSHSRMGTVQGDRAALEAVELRPYRRVLEGPHPPAAVMTAHLWVPAFDDEPTPATLSARLLSGFLRDSLGFGGLVVTDDIEMGALEERYALGERLVRALQAGADLLLTPGDLPAAVAAVRGALARGTLREADLDRSVRRTLEAKAHAGLHRQRVLPSAALDDLLSGPRGSFLAQTIADRALTLLKADEALPLGDRRTLLVQLSNYRDSESITAAMDDFERRLAERGPVREVRYDTAPPEGAAAQAVQAAQEAEVVVLALYLRLVSGRGEAGLLPAQAALAHRMLEAGTPVVLITFGNPYAVLSFDEAGTLLVAYDQTLASVQAAAGILSGLQAPQGRLPITVGPYPFGAGL